MLRASPHGMLARRPLVTAPRPVNALRSRSRLVCKSVLEQRPASSPSGSGNVKTWQASVGSSAPLIDDNSKGILYTIVDRSGQESEPASLDDWLPATYLYDKEKKGWKRYGDVLVPREFTDPVALRLFKKPGAGGDPELDYVSEFRLDMGTSKLTFPVHSWICTDHGWRVFFEPEAYLPSNTPQALAKYREQDLAELRGDGLPQEVLAAKRQGADRIYGYQVYNDLGNETSFRPALGGTEVRPYPRRIATNRRVEGGQEVNVAKDPNTPAESGPWMPYDERFNFSKQQGFLGDTLLATVPAVIQGIKKIPPWKLAFGTAYQVARKLPVLKDVLPPMAFPPVEDFEDYKDVLALYGKDFKARGVTVDQMIAPMRQRMYPAGSDAAEGRNDGGDVGDALDKAMSLTSSRQYKGDSGVWDFKLTPDEAATADENTAIAAAGPSVRTTLAKPPQPEPAGGDGAPALLMAAAPEGRAAATSVPMTEVESLPAPSRKSILGYVGRILRRQAAAGETLADQLLDYTVPRSLENRPLEWDMDEEVGRQVLAGMNPCTITALKALPESFGSAIRNKHVQADLQGSTLEELVSAAASGAKPRLYIIDYWALSSFWDQMSDDGNMVQHAGRALFYLKRRVVDGRVTEQDEAMVPVAIELAHKGNARGSAGEVYSRSELMGAPETAVIWRLAKAVFRSLDSSWHQLISHWLRTHACLEPFLIAMRRQMSVMHPVFKLMLPHFRYTMHINANARASLVNAGGIIEQNFSAGEFAMRLSSVAYRGWRFHSQALPEDLKSRGMVDPKTGKPWMEYPYAEDGMDLWSAFEEYFGAYVSRHYKDDEAVRSDVELRNWWTEATTVGHGDLVNLGLAGEEEVWGFSGPIPDRQRLVRVLATIAFTASAHHAAVNFGQYDFSGLILNFSSMVRKPMPVRGDKAWERLVNAPLGRKQEKMFMSWVAHVVGAASVMTTVKLLSSHADGEQTLEKPNKYLVNEKDAELNKAFVAKVLALEKAFEARNANPGSWARASTSLNPASMPYTLLMPTSPSGVTGRGVPYSVSI